VDPGAEILGRRGEDVRFEESRPAAQRRQAIHEAMPERTEGETRADVARRRDETGETGGETGDETGGGSWDEAGDRA